MTLGKTTHPWPHQPAPAGSGTWFDRMEYWSGEDGTAQIPIPGHFNMGVVVTGHLYMPEAPNKPVVKPGQLFCNWSHQPIILKVKEPSTFYRTRLRGHGILAYLTEMGFSKSRCLITPQQPQETIALFTSLYSTYGDTINRNAFDTLGHIYRLLNIVGSQTTRPPSQADRDQELVDRTRSLMQSMIGLPVTMTTITQALQVSTATLTRAFKRHADCTPIQMLNKLRIVEAKHLLAYTDLKIAAVSESCGFNNEKYFYRMFLKATGMTPGDYRRETTN